MKSVLLCPVATKEIPLLAEGGPLATFPLFGESLVGHWLEHIAALGATRARIVAVDRPKAVQSAVGDGVRWGLRAETVDSVPDSGGWTSTEFAPGTQSLPQPHDIVLMNHLPGDEAHHLFATYQGWFEAALSWMPMAMTPMRIRMREASPGVWIGRRARISPGARLVAPCWIGDQAFVGRGAVVGPDAIVEDRVMIEAGVTVERSYVGPDTFVGSRTAITHSIASGSLWIDWRDRSWSHVPDPFILGSLAPSPTPVHEPSEARTPFPARRFVAPDVADHPFKLPIQPAIKAQ